MAGKNVDLLPSAADAALRVAEAQEAKAEERRRAAEAAEQEKKALIQSLQKPPGLSTDEKLKRAAAFIERAIK